MTTTLTHPHSDGCAIYHIARNVSFTPNSGLFRVTQESPFSAETCRQPLSTVPQFTPQIGLIAMPAEELSTASIADVLEDVAVPKASL